jgi:ABC-type lipoprotein export system ATPase subunit
MVRLLTLKLEIFCVTLNPSRPPSTGRRQRLALASVLALEPRILVLDEPTSAFKLQRSATVDGVYTDASPNTIVKVSPGVTLPPREPTWPGSTGSDT